jgi:hypothetical protein
MTKVLREELARKRELLAGARGVLVVGLVAWLGLAGCSRSPRHSTNGQADMDQLKAQFLSLPDAYGDPATEDISRLELGLGAMRVTADTAEIPEGYLHSALGKPGDLLGRIWSLYGRPGAGDPDDRFWYTFLDTKTGVVFLAHSWNGTPRYAGSGTYSGSLPPPAEPDEHFAPDKVDHQTLLLALRSFESLLAKASLADCMVVENSVEGGLYRVGARDGRPFEEPLSFSESIDFYVYLAKRYGPDRNVGAYHLAKPAEHIRFLWVRASESERKQRPGAIDYARHSWQRDLEKLESSKGIYDPSAWRWHWTALDEQAGLLGVDPDNRRRLDLLREPPPMSPEVAREKAAEEDRLLNQVINATKHLDGGKSEEAWLLDTMEHLDGGKPEDAWLLNAIRRRFDGGKP